MGLLDHETYIIDEKLLALKEYPPFFRSEGGRR